MIAINSIRRQYLLLSFFVLVYQTLIGQQTDLKIIGTYTDGFDVTKLVLRENHTFYLNSPDIAFPYTFKRYESVGTWIVEGKEIVLNPDKDPRKIEIDFEESFGKSKDSIQIQINYVLQEFKEEVLYKTSPFKFDLLTIYINKQGNYYNVVHELKKRTCGFAPRIKNQQVIDASNQLKMMHGEVTRIGIRTYGFDSVKCFEIKEKQNKQFTITIRHPVDIERTPRRKKIIIKNKKAYMFERNGKVDTSFLANGLIKSKK